MTLKRLVLSPQLRAVVYLLFGLLAEKVAGVKWQIADPGHGNILLSSCGNIGLSSCGNIGPTTTFQAWSEMLSPKKAQEGITGISQLWYNVTLVYPGLSDIQENIGTKATSQI